MIRIFTTLAVLAPTSILAKNFDRPLPQAQTATAEFWFLIASLSLVAALVAVNWMVNRK